MSVQNPTASSKGIDIESIPEWIPRNRLKEALDVKEMIASM